jgi:hypothetical protein
MLTYLQKAGLAVVASGFILTGAAYTMLTRAAINPASHAASQAIADPSAVRLLDMKSEYQDLFDARSGQIEHGDATRLIVVETYVVVRDFRFQARIYNPYQLEDGDWDLIVEFRGAQQHKYQLRITSSRRWHLYYVASATNKTIWELIQDGYVSALDTAGDGSNLVELVTSSDSGMLIVNSVDVARLELRAPFKSSWRGS